MHWKLLNSDDELCIEQMFTHPCITPVRAGLDTGIHKTVASATTLQLHAGGFGDDDGCGIVRRPLLLASVDLPDRVRINYYPLALLSPKVKRPWAPNILAVAMYCVCRVVREKRAASLKSKEGEKSRHPITVCTKLTKSRELARPSGTKHFLARMQIFWELDRFLHVWYVSSSSSWDFFGCDQDHTLIGGKDTITRPQSGVYIQGIWVCKSSIEGVLMCFNSTSSLKVQGRDRN